MASCDKRGPLRRSGLSQTDRALAERDPGYFQLDERDTGDLILFARRFAAHLRYYDATNAAAGDWTAFFDSDISATLASLVKAPVDSFRAALADVQGFLEREPTRPQHQLRDHFSLLFHLPLALYRDMAARQSALEREHPLYPVLQELALRDIGPPLAALARYHQGGTAAGLLSAAPLDPADYTTSTNPGPGPQLSDQVARIVFTGEPFQSMALAPRAITSFAPTGWADYYTAQPPDGSPYADAVTVYDQIYDALNYNLLVSAMERVFQTLIRIQREAQVYLTSSLQNFAAHTPHYGLWLAFLSMFDKARAELNDFTGRHLDFYYEEILRLSRRGPVADHVHLLVELAKGRDAQLLPGGTLVRAGKDGLGREVSYATDEDLVVNRASVAELRAVRVDETLTGGIARTYVRASPVAASADGLGEKLPEDAKHFAPFGPSGGSFARLGFAISDRQLFMREGTRTILITGTVPGGLTANLPGLCGRLTAEEGWLDLISPAFSASLKAGELVITITLDGDDPPIVPADADLHGPEYPPDAPVLEVLVDFAGAGDAAAQTFAILRNATRTAPQIKTDASGLRQMSIRTDNGVADPSAKFMPFGPQPREGARWVIGSAEVFSRALASLDINVTWAEPYDDGDYFLVKPASDYGVLFEFLTGGTWRAGDVYPAPLDLENTTVATISAKGLYKASSDAELVAEDAPITARSRSGFLRMTLSTDFGHAEYIDKKTVALIDKSKETPDGPQDTATYNYDADDVPEEPYTPEITEISLSYESLAATAQRTYLLHPFGIEPVSGTARIFPDLPYGGALFVGVADLDPPQRLSLLAEVANGTGDPLLEAPELEHGWLGAQGWTAFEKQEVDDRTTNLAGSGILAFAMPQTASDQGGLMPAGLHWVRIAAPVNAAAVNDLISVDAQAIRATFADSGNDPAFVATPLPSGTIAKLRSPDPAIKGLRQPYSSFGGRGQEDRLDYHRRASERLRHKDRAVTVWDHEHIALEALPSIYRVKALNHTELVRLGGVVMGDNELSPGAVTVVAIPYTDTISHPNPLRPYTDRATLARLHETIAGRCSPFVRLEAANPKFEEVHVEMNVAFLPDIADTDFYRAQIEAALIEHLTPWQQRGARGAEFNGIVYKSTVIDFVEELPYVDFLEDVKLYHRPSPEVPTWTPVDAEIIRAKTARSILVSAPTHTIGLV